MTTYSRESLLDALGHEIVVSPWLEVSQDRINRFADATDDRQWIHVDPIRASGQSPFNTTIAHGFLTLALLAPFLTQAVEIAGSTLAINYGLNRVRFVAPVPAGSRVRARLTPSAIADIPGGFRVTWMATVEREGEDKPALVAEWIVQYRCAV